MQLKDCNPYVRTAQIQSEILEKTGLRKAYDYRLFYILENSGTLIVGETRYNLCPDTIIILPPATPYDFEGKLKCGVLNFDMSRDFSHCTLPLFPPIVAEFDFNSLYDTKLLDDFDEPYVHQGNYSTKQTFLKIVDQFNAHSKNSDAMTSAMLKLLFAEILNHNLTPEEKLVEKIMNYVYNNAESVGTNEDVAKELGYHPVYLSQLLRRVTGKTLHTFILDAKLKVACRWLAETDKKIDDITVLSGFCSRAHFCTLFKNKLKVSPAEYRKSHSGLLK